MLCLEARTQKNALKRRRETCSVVVANQWNFATAEFIRFRRLVIELTCENLENINPNQIR